MKNPTQPTPQPAGDAAIGQAFTQLRGSIDGVLVIEVGKVLALAEKFETARAIQAGKGEGVGESIEDRAKQILRQHSTEYADSFTHVHEKDALQAIGVALTALHNMQVQRDEFEAKYESGRAQGAGDPVAWMYRHPNGDGFHPWSISLVAPTRFYPDSEYQPLYANPAIHIGEGEAGYDLLPALSEARAALWAVISLGSTERCEKAHRTVVDAIDRRRAETARETQVGKRASDPVRELVLAVQAEYCSDHTESDEPDDSKVSFPEESCNITFGMIRRAIAALAGSQGEGVGGWRVDLTCCGNEDLILGPLFADTWDRADALRQEYQDPANCSGHERIGIVSRVSATNPDPAAHSGKCACQIELEAMGAHPGTDFDYTKACHCAGYAKAEQCQCDFCQRRLKDPAAPDGDETPTQRVLRIARSLPEWDGKTFHPELTEAMNAFRAAALSKPRQSEAEPFGYLDGLAHLELSGYATLWKHRMPGHGDLPLIPVYLATPSTAIPDGMVVVPRHMHVDAEAWEAASFAFGGPATGEGETYMDCTLWVGSIELDEGDTLHGLHVSCNECPEEGSITLATFPAAAPGSAEGV